ncbi:fatty acid desaturase [Parvularcula dongshanensis]|uniref:Beta-carotene ketolase (CrtW type) n=1 Tax=Parvularcula dongshanensis TaxID=1173995 RepID=A0A840I6M4_9PROT|nr:fatty acid desaturase [Parvularcula dongshanensis]MBB4660112.1 beta-carotene ketolase (CrtW type) [Parvularcula dongshanensis]
MTDAPARTGLIGVALATAITGAWLAAHVYGVFFLDLSSREALLAPLLILALLWLSVGLFIISHDAIHGSLAPGRPVVNRAFGWVVMTLYAGFHYDRLARSHAGHHAAPGTADDPDFSADHPDAFWPWFVQFFRHHFSWRPFLFVNAVVFFYWLVLGASPLNIVLFYGVPALGSAVQLFYFGTFRPHRHAEGAFADKHNARSDRMPALAALLTCYNFGGYHHEHHLYPHEPWWRLPRRRTEAR